MSKESIQIGDCYIMYTGPLRCHFYYFDTPKHLADSIFIDEQVRVHFDKDIGRNSKYPDYCMVLAWCWRRDRERVVTALEKLPSKMLVSGHNDYPATCKVALGEIMEKAEVDPE